MKMEVDYQFLNKTFNFGLAALKSGLFCLMKIQLIKGDITKIESDIIVCSTNQFLEKGKGVDNAIHRVAGKDLGDYCQKAIKDIGVCMTGNIVVTEPAQLQTKYVFHAVGPIWKDGNDSEEALLRSCYVKSIHIAESLKMSSISFPNISTGHNQFPKEKAARIAIQAIKDMMYKNYAFLEKVIFVCHNDENFILYNKILGE